MRGVFFNLAHRNRGPISKRIFTVAGHAFENHDLLSDLNH